MRGIPEVGHPPLWQHEGSLETFLALHDNMPGLMIEALGYTWQISPNPAIYYMGYCLERLEDGKPIGSTIPQSAWRFFPSAGWRVVEDKQKQKDFQCTQK